MTHTQFLEWLRLCPTHKWDVITEDDDHVVLTFPIEEEEETTQ